MSIGDFGLKNRQHFASCLLAVACALSIASAKAESNEEIVRWYKASAAEVSHKLEKDFATFNDGEIRIVINEAAGLRLKKARSVLVKNLWYIPFYSAMKSRLKDTPVDPVMVVNAATLFPKGQYPSYGALMSIGVEFSEIREQIAVCENMDGHAPEKSVMNDLGVASGGCFYLNLWQRKGAAADKLAMPVCFSTNLPTHFSDWRKDVKRTERVRRYDAIQAALIARFDEEQCIASTNLPDTIATMGVIRSLDAIPVLAANLTICPQVSTNSPGGFVFPAAEALIAIGPAIGDCFARLKAAEPLSVEESLWLRIAHEVYPEGLEYELFCAAATNDMRAVRLMKALPWRRLTEAEMSDSWSVGASADRP